jgi:hypothetical protein
MVDPKGTVDELWGDHEEQASELKKLDPQLVLRIVDL